MLFLKNNKLEPKCRKLCIIRRIPIQRALVISKLPYLRTTDIDRTIILFLLLRKRFLIVLFKCHEISVVDDSVSALPNENIHQTLETL